MKLLFVLILFLIGLVLLFMFYVDSALAVRPEDFGLKEGDVISASGDYDLRLAQAFHG